MKVLHAITSGDAGGAQSHVLALCEALAPSAELSVAIGSGTGTSHLGRQLAAAGVRAIHLAQMRNSTSPLQLLRACGELGPLIRDVRPDIVHAHSSFAGAAARLAARRAGVPAVYTVHGFGFKPQARSPARQAAWFGEALFAPLTASMICVSRDEARLAARLPLAARHVVVIPNGLPDVAWRADPAREPATLAMVARLAPPKRPDVLLAAMQLLSARAGLELVGDGPLRAGLESQARRLGLPGVAFSGNVQDVAQRLAGHGIFVLLSDHEGLPISVLEAMRAGLAIVASRLPGIAEMVSDGESALLVDNQPRAVSAALDRLLADPALRARLGAAARARYEREFQASVMASKVLEVYASVLARREQRNG